MGNWNPHAATKIEDSLAVTKIHHSQINKLIIIRRTNERLGIQCQGHCIGLATQTKLQDKGCDVGRLEVSESGLWHSGTNFFLKRKGRVGQLCRSICHSKTFRAPLHMKLSMNICETDDPNLQCGVLVFVGVKKSFVCHRVDLLGKFVS